MDDISTLRESQRSQRRAPAGSNGPISNEPRRITRRATATVPKKFIQRTQREDIHKKKKSILLSLSFLKLLLVQNSTLLALLTTTLSN